MNQRIWLFVFMRFIMQFYNCIIDRALVSIFGTTSCVFAITICFMRPDFFTHAAFSLNERSLSR